MTEMTTPLPRSGQDQRLGANEKWGKRYNPGTHLSIYLGYSIFNSRIVVPLLVRRWFTYFKYLQFPIVACCLIVALMTQLSLGKDKKKQ